MAYSLSFDLQRFSHISSSKKIWIVGSIIGLFIIGIFAGSFYSRIFRSRLAPISMQQSRVTPAAQGSVSFSPASGSLQLNEEKEVVIWLKDISAEAADLVFTYDQSKLKIINVSAGTDFPMLLSQNNNNGVFSASVSISPDDNPAPTTGELLKLKVKGVGIGPSSLIFDKEKTIIAREGKAVQIGLQNTTYEIK